MSTIKFKRTAHTMLNNGIIGLYDYLNKAKKSKADGNQTFNFDFVFKLTENELKIESEKLMHLLEELYYWMGSDYYDTVTIEQEKEVEEKGVSGNKGNYNLYFDEKLERFKPFPKITNYGMPVLLTNARPKNTKKEKNQTTIKELEKVSKEKASKFKNEFKRRELKLGSVIYFNEPYTTIPRLPEFKIKYLQEGNEICYWTGENVKTLVDVNNNSIFIKKQGIDNFKPFFNNSQNKVSWKAMYLARFSPVHAFYHYAQRTKKSTVLHTYFFEASHLGDLNSILKKVDLEKDKLSLKANHYYSNISFTKDLGDGVSEKSEVLLSLLYTLYKKVINNYGGENLGLLDDLFGEGPKLPKFSILGVQSNSYQTLRPVKYSHVNRTHSVVNTFLMLEKKGIRFKRLFPSLKLIKPSDKSSQSSYRLERVLRDNICERFLKGSSIIDLIEDLYVRCYGYICANENVGYKDYDQIFKFFQLYELKVNPMDEQLQQMAIKLGQQIGFRMKAINNSLDEKANAKSGRGDLISLRKARTMKQFLDELIRIDFKYGLSIKDDIATKINEQSYYTIKQFMIIGALNILNPVIHPYSKEDNNAKNK